MSLITRGLKSNLLISRGLGFSSSPVVVETTNGGNFVKKRKVKIGKAKLNITLVGKLEVRVARKYKLLGNKTLVSKLDISVKSSVLHTFGFLSVGQKIKSAKERLVFTGSKIKSKNLVFSSFGALAVKIDNNINLSGTKFNGSFIKADAIGNKTKDNLECFSIIGKKNNRLLNKFSVVGRDNPFELASEFTETQQIALMDVDL